MSRLALARIDFERTELSAETFTNWMPRVLGSMMVRPGGEYLGATAGNNKAVYIPFVFSNSDTALIESTANVMRIWENDSLVSRDTSVTAAITNGNFTDDITEGWTQDDDSGATSSHHASGYLQLLGDGTSYAKTYQEVTVNEASTEHALRIMIVRGPVNLRVGTSAGDDSYISASLGTGVHSLAFTPTGNFFIQFESNANYPVLVDYVANEITLITNGTFDSDLTGWTDDDDAGAASTWETGGFMQLLGDGVNYAKRYQEIEVYNIGTEHTLQVTIEQGPVVLKVGTSAGDDSYISTSLSTGFSSLDFTPTGNFFIQFESNTSSPVQVDSVAIVSGSVVAIPTTWDESDLENLRFRDAQSGDIIFVACAGQQQRKIERRANSSWSFVKYETIDGPFRNINISSTTLTPSATTGLITLTASKELFEAEHVGALFRVGSIGQLVSVEIDADENKFTEAIRVTGLDQGRKFTVNITGTGGTSSVVTLQRSVDDDSSWTDVKTYGTANFSENYNDNLDNQIIYYRIGIKTGEYDPASGTVVLTLTYSAGSIDGVVRITAVASATSASAVVLVDLGGTTASDYWWEGMWSDYRGWPTAVAFYEARLWWAGKDKINGSITDGFYSFDDGEEGDSAPISRSIGSGPVDSINWMLPAKTLLLGADGAVFSARSNSFEEPLTRTNFNLRRIDTQGCLGVQAVDIDNTGVFVQASGQRVYETQYDTSSFDYNSIDLTAIVPELCNAGITKVVVQRQPDTRLHFILADGTVAILVRDATEEVKCWVTYETDGEVEDAVVLPGTEEDNVYYVVKRTINSVTKRYLEKWAKESECRGATINKLADSFYIYSGSSVTTISGLDHLEGETVCVWGNGIDLGTYTVSSGAISGISESVTYAIVGLVYTADWKSVKLAYAAQAGTALLQKKRVSQLGFVAADIHAQGIKYGKDFNNLFNLPQTKGWTAIDADEINTAFDENTFVFPGSWDTDSRICLRATAPRPVTVMALVFGINTHDKI
jgi:hypothetical protein